MKGSSKNDLQSRLEQALLHLLENRRPGATICPGEAARAIGGDDESEWRPLMEPTRAAAKRLAAAGTVRITQKGEPVDPDDAKGPIRIGLA